MNKVEREKAISNIQKFIDSGEEVDGKVRFGTMDAISATYSMALLILDMEERIEKLDKKEMDYNKRSKKFAGL